VNYLNNKAGSLANYKTETSPEWLEKEVKGHNPSLELWAEEMEPVQPVLAFGRLPVWLPQRGRLSRPDHALHPNFATTHATEVILRSGEVSLVCLPACLLSSSPLRSTGHPHPHLQPNQRSLPLFSQVVRVGCDPRLMQSNRFGQLTFLAISWVTSHLRQKALWLRGQQPPRWKHRKFELRQYGVLA
jgi:hypothetical protein